MEYRRDCNSATRDNLFFQASQLFTTKAELYYRNRLLSSLSLPFHRWQHVTTARWGRGGPCSATDESPIALYACAVSRQQSMRIWASYIGLRWSNLQLATTWTRGIQSAEVIIQNRICTTTTFQTFLFTAEDKQRRQDQGVVALVCL